MGYLWGTLQLQSMAPIRKGPSTQHRTTHDIRHDRIPRENAYYSKCCKGCDLNVAGYGACHLGCSVFEW